MDRTAERGADDRFAAPEENAEGARRSFFLGPRAALALFVALEAIALPLMVSWGHDGWFNIDDWDFLTARRIGNFGDLMRPHFGHWTTLPVIAYRVLWWMVGLRSYTPYLMLVIGAHLAVAALLRAVMRRAGIGPWLATLGAAVFLFYGSGAENVLVAFQVTFVGAVMFGLGHLLLADHDGPLDRRDWLGVLAGFAGLLCSGVGPTMVLVVGLAVLLRRGWRFALFHTAPPAVIYLIWLLTATKGQHGRIYVTTSPSAVFGFVAVGFEATFSRLGQLPGVGVLLGLLLVVGLVQQYAPRGWRLPHGSTAAPLALLVGAAVFLFTTGVFRSGEVVYAQLRVGGADRARMSRYLYVVAALALPAVALAAATITRRRRRVTFAVIAVLAIGVPGNVAQFVTYANEPTYVPGVRRSLLRAARIPLANQLPRSLEPQPFFAGGATMGWLLDNRERIPSPGALSRDEIATATLNLALQPASTPPRTTCRALGKPTVLVLRKSDSLTAKTGVISVYLQLDGGRSRPRRLPQSTTVVARAGPLRLLLVVPPGTHRAVVCTKRQPT